MFALVENGTIVKYPYELEALARDNPNTSFGVALTDTELLDFGVHRVFFSTIPQITWMQTFEESTPVFNNERWEQSWLVRDLTSDELQTKIAEHLEGIRLERNRRLVESDWTQGKDIPDSVSSPWSVYRQQLRDLPSTITEPCTFTNWPEAPL
jgi:hypothetical protein